MDETPDGPLLERLPRSAPSTSSERVFRSLLAGIYDGSLPPGLRVSEHTVASQYGVSRTPAREAVQRLRDLGLVDASAGRASRVVCVDEAELRHALVAWEALYEVVIAEVIDTVQSSHLDAMRERAAEFRDAAAAREASAASQANQELFAIPVALSDNPALADAVGATVCIVRLGSHTLPRWIAIDPLADAQVAFIDALERRDAGAAIAAVRDAVRFELSPE